MKKIWTVSAMMIFNLMAYAQSPVEISVESTKEAVISVSTPTMSLSGTASAVAGVTRVTWRTSAGVTGTASGTTKWEARDIPVADGNTTIVLRAYDSKGASEWVALVTVRKSATIISSATDLLSAEPQRQPGL